MVHPSWTPFFALLSVVAAIIVPRQTKDGVHLAITPTCGKLDGTFTNVNAGIATRGIKTLVAFGDSYTSGGRSDGGPLPPAVLTGTNPRAEGRVTDGPVWAEDVASDLGATIKDYAVAGAVVNVTLWPNKAGQSSSPERAEEIRQRRLELRDPHIPRSPFRSEGRRRAEEHQEIAESPANLTTLADAVGDSANEPKSPVESTRNPQKTPVKQTSSADGGSRKQRPLRWHCGRSITHTRQTIEGK